MSAVARSSGLSPDEEDMERERVAGLGGQGSKVWEIVVVAVTTEERRWDMSNSAVVGERVFWIFEDEGRYWYAAEVEEEGKGSRSGSGSVPVVLRPSRLVRGVPVLISVETDWFREMRVEVAAD